MELRVSICALTPRRPFRISRGEKRIARNVFVSLRDGSHCGYGEGSPNAFYSETPEAAAQRLIESRPLIEKASVETPDDIARMWHELWPSLRPSRAAQCALDLAHWDLLAKRRGKTVAALATGSGPGPVTTFCTIGLCDEAELGERLREVEGFPRVKIKSDATANLDLIRHIAAMSAAGLAVDANCAWTPQQVRSHTPALAELGVLFLEQPLPPAQDDQMPALLASSALPILADESCATETDVEKVPSRFGGFNIKLVKCGGLTPALRMLRTGRKLGLTMMTGCMLESSLLISAAMTVAADADFADLDGAWLLADDPFEGLRFTNGVLHPSGEPGFGVAPVLPELS